MDLFNSSFSDKNGKIKYDSMAPLAVRMRPRNIDEVLGQKHILGKFSVMRNLIESSSCQVSSVILYGPAGSGKTTLAYLVANNNSRDFVELSAVDANVKQVREVIEEAKRKLISKKIQTVLFIDEIHRFSKSQQDALLPAVENQWVILIAATTENPYFSINSPLLSRSILLTLFPHNNADIYGLLELALKDDRGYKGKLQADSQALDFIVDLASGDCRKALTILEACATKCFNENVPLDKQIVLNICNVADLKYDRDHHYDIVSAFIKSIRGSNVDAALHYLACMIEGGEDIKFILRRIMISASEDIGLADSNALQVATSACIACEKVGLPEARIILSQAVIYLALAPKSNSAYMAIEKALCDVRKGLGKKVPIHLRDAHYKGAKNLKHGVDYKYPHDYKNNLVFQQYLPDDISNKIYYEPSTNGDEKILTNIVNRLRIFFKNSI